MLTQNNQPKNQSQSGDADINGNNATESTAGALENLLEEDLPPIPQEPKQKKWGWRSLSLRSKATLLAVMISTIPVVAIGSVTYYFSSRSLDEQIRESQLQKTNTIANKINRFIYERYGDIQVLANHPIFTNRKAQSVINQAEREAVLNDYAKVYGVYNLIAFADLEGNTPIRSTITDDPVPNIKESDFFKMALSTGKPFISQPGKSTATKKVSLYLSS
ncbi:MAG: hypothetical protein IM583_16225, partial [Pseudanabaena sp. M114S2SP2A07QC]|nr:hypothetical protein [Pseudanabaena sp. M114S2SP2A07QC]